MKNKYYKQNPVNNKAIAKDCEQYFCKTYSDKLRLACALNNVETKHIHLVRIGNKQTVIILN
jgi:hypothetical protein